MPLVALVCAGLLGLAVDDPAPPAVAAEYQQIRAAARPTADDQVGLALWCEAHGLTAERARHLSLAVLADPTHAVARGLSGLVARDGRWVAPDSVARAVRADADAAALLAEYDRRRIDAAYTADAQWDLGVWADEHGLKEQARAHLTAVTRIDPGHELAWKRLGYKQHDGRWTTHAQIAADRAEADAQRRADRRWRPLLEKWRGMLDQPARRDAARVALLDVTDPRALPSVTRVFGTGLARDQEVAVGLLGQVEAPGASRALAALAVRGQTAAIRQAATETLARRDAREFLDQLVDLIRRPFRIEIRPGGPRGGGELHVAGERYNIRRLYTPPPADAQGRWDLILKGLAANSAAAQPGGPPPAAGRAIAVDEPDEPDAAARAVAQARRDNLDRARQAVRADIEAVEAANKEIRATNDRVRPILARITGQDLGEDHDAWARWGADQKGYAYQSASDVPTFSQVVDIAYQPASTGHSCFGAGTLVRTIGGDRRIEQVERGDLVLAQDTTTGALSYQPVLAAFHNPPGATVRVKFAGDEVVATGIHRFWRAGKGWSMARDLKPGDLLRLVGGVARVEAVTPDATQPVFNLEVAEGHSFFVGRAGALVHDNSLVAATPSPFDAPMAVVAATGPR